MTKEIYIAFDIDGTIYDAGEILEEAFRTGIKSFVEKGSDVSLKMPSREEITATLGYPLPEIFMMLFPAMDELARERLSDLWTENLVSLIRGRKGTLIDGVEETVKILSESGYKMLVASNGAREYVEAILETYDLKRFFSEPFLYAEDKLKNKTDIIRQYISINPERGLIMVGDRYTDLAAARENGIPFIGCSFGHAGADEIEGEKYIISHFSEIPEIIERIINNSLKN